MCSAFFWSALAETASPAADTLSEAFDAAFDTASMVVVVYRYSFNAVVLLLASLARDVLVNWLEERIIVVVEWMGRIFIFLCLFCHTFGNTRFHFGSPCFVLGST